MQVVLAWGPPRAPSAGDEESSTADTPGQDLEAVPGIPLPGDTSYLRPPTTAQDTCSPDPHATVLCHRESADQKGRDQPKAPRSHPKSRTGSWRGGKTLPRTGGTGAAPQEGGLLLQECRCGEGGGLPCLSSLPPGPLPTSCNGLEGRCCPGHQRVRPMPGGTPLPWRHGVTGRKEASAHTADTARPWSRGQPRLSGRSSPARHQLPRPEWEGCQEEPSQGDRHTDALHWPCPEPPHQAMLQAWHQSTL